jgi:kynurenine formamidase
VVQERWKPGIARDSENIPRRPENLSVEEFDNLFESVKNWGRWGADDNRGTLNLIGQEEIRRAAGLVKEGTSVSMALPVNTSAGPDNPRPALHYMCRTHDTGSGDVTGATDFFGLEFHGTAHTHVDALCHIAYRGLLYNGLPADSVSAVGAKSLDITAYSSGIMGRGVLLDIPRLRGVPWLEPGTAVTGAELEMAARAEGVTVGKGDILVFRTGQHRRRMELGPWDNDITGAGRAGLHASAIRTLHDWQVAAFLPDGDGETIPSTVDGIDRPIHALQVVAMGMAVSDSLDLEQIADACAERGRFDFMVVATVLPIVGGTGSPWNPIAVL